MWRTCIKNPTLALSSTEAKLSSMLDAGKAALYLQSILEEVNINQSEPTHIIIDKKGASLLSTSQQSLRRTRHIETATFAIIQWTEENQIKYDLQPFHSNISDSVSKPSGHILFHEHNNIIMGCQQSQYITNINTLYFPDATDTTTLYHFHPKSGEAERDD
jgi:hypothetical protein